MTKSHTVAFGLSFADKSIPWPARGSGERTLADREGWERADIPVKLCGEPATIKAMQRGALAVNVMVDTGEGFAICLAQSGHRFSYNGSVFARCDAAMKAAEEMMATDVNWTMIAANGFSERARVVLRDVIKAAESRGDILLDRIFPS